MQKEHTVPPNRIIDAFSWRNLALDLKILYFWLGLTVVSIFIPVLNESPFRIIIALPVAIFIPGYCLTAALFPGRQDIDGIERIALSIGLSIMVIPLIGLWLNYTVWGIRVVPIMIALIIFSVIMVQIAQYRRFLLPEEERFSVIFDTFMKGIKDSSPSQKDVPLSRGFRVIIIVALIAAVCTTIGVIFIPKEGERFTEFYILGQNGTATDYPTNIIEGSSEQVIIGIDNHEFQNTNYVVEMWLTNITFNTTTNTTMVSQMERLDKFSLRLQHNVFYQEPHRFTVPATGFNKLTFLLFKDSAPPDQVTGYERINSSYRNLQLWVTVRPPD
jgi:uncharacterized membrane protein